MKKGFNIRLLCSICNFYLDSLWITWVITPLFAYILIFFFVTQFQNLKQIFCFSKDFWKDHHSQTSQTLVTPISRLCSCVRLCFRCRINTIERRSLFARKRMKHRYLRQCLMYKKDKKWTYWASNIIGQAKILIINMDKTIKYW